MRVCIFVKFLLLQQMKVTYLGQGQIVYNYTENYNTSLKLLSELNIHSHLFPWNFNLLLCSKKLKCQTVMEYWHICKY